MTYASQLMHAIGDAWFHNNNNNNIAVQQQQQQQQNLLIGNMSKVVEAVDGWKYNGQ